MASTQAQPAESVLFFEITSQGFQPLNRCWEEMLGLTPNRWVGISRGGWRSLVPEEYHLEVEKLTMLEVSDSYTVVEFPVCWQDSTKWLLVFAAAVALPEGGRKIVGLVQDVTPGRKCPYAPAQPRGPEVAELNSEFSTSQSGKTPASPEPASESVEDLCHELSGPLTSILVNCELLMEDDCPPPVRQRLEGIFSEAMHINQQLRSHRRS